MPKNIFYGQGFGSSIYCSIGYQYNLGKQASVNLSGFAIPFKSDSYETFSLGFLLNPWSSNKKFFLSFENGVGYYRQTSSIAKLNNKRGNSMRANSLYFQPSFNI